MKSISIKRFNSLISNLKRKKIAVVGDLMVDRYFWGKVSRISPEAPVPIVDIEREFSQLGGAANVGNNIKFLGGEPFLIGVIGDDNTGTLLLELLKSTGFSVDGIVVDPSRPTTIKTRVIADNQHVVRTDRESREEINGAIEKKIIKIIKEKISEFDGIILEDYNKGVLKRGVIHKAISVANDIGIPVNVDPKFDNFFEYKKATVFKPNQREVEIKLGFQFTDDVKLIEAGKILLEKIECENILITRGEKGMTLFKNNGEYINVPTRAKVIHDVSGAGDTVIATLTAVLVAGGDVEEAATIANYAAGIVCGEVGVVPIELKKLREVFTNNK
jgi:rfaE bifunctional protein kinase chain/domain